MCIGGARQVCLLGFAGNILDLHQHQSGLRAGEIALDRIPERRMKNRLAIIRQEPQTVAFGKQALGDQCIKQQVTIPDAFIGVRGFGRVIAAEAATSGGYSSGARKRPSS